jgi:hypothetical protein
VFCSETAILIWCGNLQITHFYYIGGEAIFSVCCTFGVMLSP